jgi:head-tail adaptor
MNTLISIAREVVAKDSEGFATKTDQVLASAFAYREGRHGSQKWVNRAAFSEATDLFRFRVIPGLAVTTAHVILCGEDRFEVTSVEDVKGRGMYLEALAKRVIADG